ncbi:MAG: glycosyltransferase [Sulfuritalea sp.]|nr:glycosyltransferase [Sulfuritalea sp.]
MSAPLLTLVVPVYNVAPYLPRCLESLAALSPPADEIIVVDDGSTDECPRILAEFGSRLPQMRVIRQENGGLSAARNTALEVATGTYLAFVDSDDFVSPDAYAEALRLAQDDGLDMVLLNANYHFEGREADYPIYANVAATEVITGREWLRRRFRAGRFLHMVWMHLYRRDFIERHHFRFIPRLIHEDVIWTTEALLAAQRVRYTGHIAVHYRIPVRRFNPEQAQRRLQAIVDSSVVNAEALARMADSLDHDAELQGMLSDHLVDGALSVFHKLPKMPDRHAAATTLQRLRESGFIGLLWRHARSAAQRRRLARHWLRSWLAGFGK